MNIFDVRTFNEDEKKAIKNVVDDVIVTMGEIADLQDHIKEVTKDLAEKLNENVATNEEKVKPTLFTKMAKAHIKNKEDIEKTKSEMDEVETALHVIYNM